MCNPLNADALPGLVGQTLRHPLTPTLLANPSLKVPDRTFPVLSKETSNVMFAFGCTHKIRAVCAAGVEAVGEAIKLPRKAVAVVPVISFPLNVPLAVVVI